MAKILVVAPSYDSQTRRSHLWAQRFADDLDKAGHATVRLLGSRANATSLRVALKSVDWLVFFGHGEPDRFIGQRSRLSLGAGPTLLDTTEVQALQNVRVYAVCCQSSLILGKAYESVAPRGAFLGYAAPFGLSVPNAKYFEDTINTHGRDFVSGNKDARTAREDLHRAWESLSEEFFNGSLVKRPDHFGGGFTAATNALFVRLNPKS
jgi:hypothetical protein